MSQQKCVAKTNKGNRCKNLATKGDRCHLASHQPEVDEKRAIENNRPTISGERRIEVWSKYIGIGLGQIKCPYNNCTNSINPLPGGFECGHVIAHSKGGDISVENLRPICKQCNLNMGNNEMDLSKWSCKEKITSIISNLDTVDKRVLFVIDNSMMAGPDLNPARELEVRSIVTSKWDKWLEFYYISLPKKVIFYRDQGFLYFSSYNEKKWKEELFIADQCYIALRQYSKELAENMLKMKKKSSNDDSNVRSEK